MNRKWEFILLVSSLLCIPIAIVDYSDAFSESFDTNWLFLWGSYSYRFGLFYLISFSGTLWFRLANLTCWFLSLLWLGATTVSYFILQRGRENTFQRDISFLAILLIGQVLAPLALFTLVMQGTSVYIFWILPFPGPSLIAMALRVFYRIKVKE